jgi:glucose-1-phosphate cytidylyltransferase
MVAFKHTGFWRPMDTLRDKMELENMWNSGNAKWKIL